MLCLLIGQRSQTISSLKVDGSILAHGTYTFYIYTIQKLTWPGRHQSPLVLQSFEPNEKLCIINYLKEYRSRTDLLSKNLEGTQQFISSHAYPYKPVNSQKIAQYVKIFWDMSGIDIMVFNWHSARTASASTTNKMGLSIKDIKKQRGGVGIVTFASNIAFQY